ncbi:MAG: hypothetical protein DWI61_03885 [Chloroflexi bacterium]|nr:MAG: hypothetical protein DWI61_03885 [Chloroflexota bacterium]
MRLAKSAGARSFFTGWVWSYSNEASMKVYLAGPLFSQAERDWLSSIAARLRADAIECFVPHEAFAGTEPGSATAVFADDLAGMRSCDLMLAWLDGAMVDDGTAAEIGIFSEWVRRGEKLAIIGCCTDLRQIRRRSLAEHAGLNLFVAGAIQSAGVLVWSIEAAIAAVKNFA